METETKSPTSISRLSLSTRMIALKDLNLAAENPENQFEVDLTDSEDCSDCENGTKQGKCITQKCGTIIYASPEQLNTVLESFDQRSDIYSIGVIMAQLFCPTYSYLEME